MSRAPSTLTQGARNGPTCGGDERGAYLAGAVHGSPDGVAQHPAADRDAAHDASAAACACAPPVAQVRPAARVGAAGRRASRPGAAGESQYRNHIG